MNLSTIVIYAPEPSFEYTARFYGALLDAQPVRSLDHYAVAAQQLQVKVYAAERHPYTATALEFIGDAEAAADRLIERAWDGPEQTRDGRGWWTTDPCGNPVVLLRE
jgi:hypothetical protein